MRRSLMGALFCIAMLLVNGCAASVPTRFYILSALDPAGDADRAGCRDGRTFTVGIGPIEVPRYLDRPQIMTRLGPNELALAELELWAEPLKEAIPRVLARNLHAQTCAEVEVDVWKKTGQADYLLTAVVNRLDGTLGGDAVLEVTWTLTDERMKKTIMTRTSTYTESVRTRDYRTLAASYSSLIAAFSREVAGALASLPSEKGGAKE
ncbi:MAG TPA: PqiC family protein [Deltaproteobacteria bacterium]|nr:PqiC family protein [Deltaproteobacteria bacterium]